ncbi:MAG: Gldg family protein [Gammaproteobacteria bacterium]|nr:Gldg family protein [Gammaproteobacteria bacterium]MBI5618988.1 Gldg family protein [Gammaproteobacteria bacterium]
MNTRIQTTYGIVIALALFLGVNIIANETLTAQRMDLTQNRLYTLSTGSRNILAKIDEPITLRYYYSAKRFADIPQYLNHGKRVRDLLEEYVAASHGHIKLLVIDPEPFSEAEDQAVGAGIEQLPLNASGEVAYLGLVGSNTTDMEIPIPYLNPDREDAVEYEITKLVYTLANPKKRVIGVISSLPVFGGPPDKATGEPGREWATMAMMKEVFEVKPLEGEITKIDPEIDTLLIIHPKDLPRPTLYAIDQFVLHGGKAMVFVDPLAEEDRPGPEAAHQMAIPKVSSDLAPLFEKWGLKLVPDKIVGDLDAAVRVSFGGERGSRDVDYLPWLALHRDRLNRDDFVTNQLKVINVGSAGALEAVPNTKTKFVPLISTGPKSGFIDRDAVFFVRDPEGLIKGFTADKKDLTVAARISGPVDTAFPEGRPLGAKEKSAPPDANFVKSSKGGINVIVVADTDLLTDRFWVRVQRVMGMQVPNPFANNADFLINAIDNLGGNDDLIGLRSRGEYARPFEVVERIQREAEAQFRDQEQALQGKLKETEAKLRELQQNAKGDSLLTAEQKQEIEQFRQEQVKTRKQLRAVQHDLQKNIEKLGTTLKFVNIGLVPVLISLLAIIIGLIGSRRSRTAG